MGKRIKVRRGVKKAGRKGVVLYVERGGTSVYMGILTKRGEDAPLDEIGCCWASVRKVFGHQPPGSVRYYRVKPVSVPVPKKFLD